MRDFVPLERGEYYHVYNRATTARTSSSRSATIPTFSAYTPNTSPPSPIRSPMSCCATIFTCWCVSRIQDLAGLPSLQPSNSPTFSTATPSPSTKPTVAPAACSRNALAVFLSGPAPTLRHWCATSTLTPRSTALLPTFASIHTLPTRRYFRIKQLMRCEMRYLNGLAVRLRSSNSTKLHQVRRSFRLLWGTLIRESTKTWQFSETCQVSFPNPPAVHQGCIMGSCRI